MRHLDAFERFHQLARVWNVAIEQVRETEAALVGFGRRAADALVLKVLKRRGDEWTSGEVLQAFRGCGVVRVYEVVEGAMLVERNPIERPDLFVSTSIVERRVTRLAARLSINADRAIAWAFAQAVLSAIWSVEDGESVNAQHPVLRLAEAIRPLLRESV